MPAVTWLNLLVLPAAVTIPMALAGIRASP